MSRRNYAAWAKALDLLEREPSSTMRELAAHIGLANGGAHYVVTRLEREGRLKRHPGHRHVRVVRPLSRAERARYDIDDPERCEACGHIVEAS